MSGTIIERFVAAVEHIQQRLERVDTPLAALIRRERFSNHRPRFHFGVFTILTLTVVALAMLIALDAPKGPGGAQKAAETVFFAIHYGTLFFIWACIPLWAAQSLSTDLETNALDDIFATPLEFSEILAAKGVKALLYAAVVYVVLFAAGARFYSAANMPIWPHLESLPALLAAATCAASIGFCAATRPLSRPAMVLWVFGVTLAILLVPALFHWARLTLQHAQSDGESIPPQWRSAWLFHPWSGWGRPLPLILYLTYLLVFATAFHRFTLKALHGVQGTGLPHAGYKGATSYSRAERYWKPATCLFYHASPFSRSGVQFVLALIGFTAGIASRTSLNRSLTGPLWVLDVDYLVALAVLFSIAYTAHRIGQSELNEDLKVTLLSRPQLLYGRYWATVLLTMPFVLPLVAGCQLKMLYLYFGTGEFQTAKDVLAYECYVGTYLTLALYVSLIGCERLRENQRGELNTPSSSLLSGFGIFQGEHIIIRIVYQFASERWIADAIRLGVYASFTLLILVLMRFEYADKKSCGYDDKA